MALQGVPVESPVLEGNKIALGWRNWLDLVIRKTLDRLNSHVWSGTGAPEGVIAAPVGSIYLDDNGGTATLYVKQSGGATSTGWVAK